MNWQKMNKLITVSIHDQPLFQNLNTLSSFDSVMFPKSRSGFVSKLFSILVATLEGAVTVVFMAISLGTFMTYFFCGVFLMILIGDFLTGAMGFNSSGIISNLLLLYSKYDGGLLLLSYFFSRK